VAYTWDQVGRRATMTDPDAGVTSYQYDSANRLTSLTNPFNETTGLQYDAAGRPVRQNNDNGTYSTWAFDAGGQVGSVATKKSDNSAVLTMDYIRDAVGSPTSVTEQLLDTDNQTVHNATLTFGYDNANRLTSEKRAGSDPIWYEYAMDGAGNRTQFVEKDQQGTPVGTTNATYSADNRLLTHGNLTFGYDGNGNRTSKTVNQVTTTYAYNHDNRMTALHDGATLTFSYNGDGLRQSRTVDGTTTQYAYDGVRLLKEFDAAGATETSYTLAPLGDEWYPLLSDRKAGASRFYAFDALGTTRALTADSQLPTAVWTDDAYGNLLSATDPAATPHQYLGKLGYHTDAASGLQLLTQRYYDPVVGTFVSEDPVRDGGNWYAYVSARPTDFLDPEGLGGHTKGKRPSTHDKHTGRRAGDPEKGDARRAEPTHRPTQEERNRARNQERRESYREMAEQAAREAAEALARVRDTMRAQMEAMDAYMRRNAPPPVAAVWCACGVFMVGCGCVVLAL